MGYYANYEGSITFKQRPAADILYELEKMFDNFDFDDARYEATFGGYDKYRGYEDVSSDLDKIKEFVKSGEIEFKGEDGCNWRFIFKDDEWIDENGYIVYESEKPVSNEDRPEFLGEIIDVFEDFLEEKGINIPNEDRPDEEGAAIIYGMDYGFLSEELYKLMKGWNIL